MKAGQDALPQTPLFIQYGALRERTPGAVLLFRLGDFYEMFGEDAKIGSDTLGLALTSRDGQTPMAGVPVSSLESALTGLVEAGYRVAVAEQMEAPGQGKPLVRRDIVRVVSPGTLVAGESEEGDGLRLVAAACEEEGGISFALADVVSGEFRAMAFTDADPLTALAGEIARLQPAEVVVLGPGPVREKVLAAVGERRLCDAASVGILQVSTQPVPGEESLPETARRAARLVWQYVHTTQRERPSSLRPVVWGLPEGVMQLPLEVRRHLNLGLDGESTGLYRVVSRCRTAMGRRALRIWLGAPLTELASILERQQAIADLVADSGLMTKLADGLSGLADIERTAVRAGQGTASPREVVHLGQTLEALPNLQDVVAQSPAGPLRKFAAQLAPPQGLGSRIVHLFVDVPPATATEGGLVRDGADGVVDRLRALVRGGHEQMAEIEREERERTGIRQLKVGFHRKLGYFLELPRNREQDLPEDYRVIQGLAQAVRYTTPRLRTFSREVEEAEEKQRIRESEVFFEVRETVGGHLAALRAVANALAELDVRLSLAEVARDRGWIRPEVTRERGLRIVAGRHPVLDAALAPGRFVPNDLSLGIEADLAVVTGPNMGGKSTYLRQTALLVILAQIGSFVPAERCRIGLVDRIFTRIGSGDDLAAGESTFMREMREVALILHQATRRSLVVVDELGRGTATYDGLSLAWAVVEHLATRQRPLALIATHYHELIDLAEQLPKACNLCVQVAEVAGEVRFLHRVVPGGADRSYGIAVARLAGLPPSLLRRAQELLGRFETGEGARQTLGESAPRPSQALLGTDLDAPLRRELSAADPSRMTPLDALVFLTALRERVVREQRTQVAK